MALKTPTACKGVGRRISCILDAGHRELPAREKPVGQSIGSASSSKPPSDTLCKKVRTSIILSLLHQLLLQHEVRLALELLERFAISEVATSRLSITNFALQKVLASFAKDAREKKEAFGLRIIENSIFGETSRTSTAPNLDPAPLASSALQSPRVPARTRSASVFMSLPGAAPQPKTTTRGNFFAPPAAMRGLGLFAVGTGHGAGGGDRRRMSTECPRQSPRQSVASRASAGSRPSASTESTAEEEDDCFSERETGLPGVPAGDPCEVQEHHKRLAGKSRRSVSMPEIRVPHVDLKSWFSQHQLQQSRRQKQEVARMDTVLSGDYSSVKSRPEQPSTILNHRVSSEVAPPLVTGEVAPPPPPPQPQQPSAEPHQHVQVQQPQQPPQSTQAQPQVPTEPDCSRAAGCSCLPLPDSGGRGNSIVSDVSGCTYGGNSGSGGCSWSLGTMMRAPPQPPPKAQADLATGGGGSAPSAAQPRDGPPSPLSEIIAAASRAVDEPSGFPGSSSAPVQGNSPLRGPPVGAMMRKSMSMPADPDSASPRASSCGDMKLSSSMTCDDLSCIQGAREGSSYNMDDFGEACSNASEDSEHQLVDWSDELDDLTARQVNWLATPSGCCMIHPNNLKRVAWDLLSLVMIVMECITLPLRLCFSITLPDTMGYISTCFFTLDIALNFNTGFFHKELLIMRRDRISRKYLRSWFILDFTSTFPWEEVLGSLTGGGVGGGNGTLILRMAKLGKLMRCLRLLRLMKIGRLLSRFQDIDFFHSYTVSFALSLAKMLSIFAMLCHWSACVWGYIGDPESMGDMSTEGPHPLDQCVPGGPCENGIWGTPWRRRYGLDNFDLGTQYLAALHFATGLVTGSELALQPAFWAERLFTTIMMILGLFICTTVLSQVLVMINRLAEKNVEKNEQIRSMREFLVTRKVPAELQAKVRRYLETQADMKQGAGDFEVMNYLSPSLRDEVWCYLSHKAMSKHPFFQILPAEPMRAICLQATPHLYAPDEVAVERGHLALSAHFVVRGKLRVERVMQGKSAYLSPGSWMGDTCLFAETVRSHTVSAVTPSEVITIQKRFLLAVCKEFPSIQSAYDAFQQQVLEGADCLSCAYCKKPGHSAEDCPDKKRAERSHRLAQQKLGALTRMRTSVAAFQGAHFQQTRTSFLGRIKDKSESGKASPTGVDSTDSTDILSGRKSLAAILPALVSGTNEAGAGAGAAEAATDLAPKADLCPAAGTARAGGEGSDAAEGEVGAEAAAEPPSP